MNEYLIGTDESPEDSSKLLDEEELRIRIDSGKGLWERSHFLFVDKPKINSYILFMENITDIRTFLDNPTNNLSLWLNGFEKFHHFHEFISADGKLHVYMDYLLLNKMIKVKVSHMGENLDGKIETYRTDVFTVHYPNKKEVKSLISFIDEKWLTKSIY